MTMRAVGNIKAVVPVLVLDQRIPPLSRIAALFGATPSVELLVAVADGGRVQHWIRVGDEFNVNVNIDIN